MFLRTLLSQSLLWCSRAEATYCVKQLHPPRNSGHCNDLTTVYSHTVSHKAQSLKAARILYTKNTLENLNVGMTWIKIKMQGGSYTVNI